MGDVFLNDGAVDVRDPQSSETCTRSEEIITQ